MKDPYCDPNCFSVAEWQYAKQIKFNNATGERSAAERLIAESQRMYEDAHITSYKKQDDVTKKLEQRIQDVHFWKSEVDIKLDILKNETDKLVAFKTRLIRTIEACDEPLHIIRQCIELRKNRIGIDLTCDDVHRQLLREEEVFLGVLALLKRTLEKTTEQIRLNRKAIFKMENDAADKEMALDIDKNCVHLSNKSRELEQYTPMAEVKHSPLSIDDWQQFTSGNIKTSEQERMSSSNLRSLINNILMQVAKDTQQQQDIVNKAFEKRIQETKDVKCKLEKEHAAVLLQIRDMEDNIGRLDKAIAEKTPFLVLSEKRLNSRTYRPNIELCHDAIQARIEIELAENQQAIANLKEKRAQSEDSLRGLNRIRQILKEDIDIKTYTLFIDETQCMTLRKAIKIISNCLD